MELEAAEASGEAIAGAALDWRQAFDNVPFEHVVVALARARAPVWLAGPVLSAYRADRRLRVDQGLGI
eukprot:1361256-Lingulodinium_polyedra.AAC.1